MLLLFENAKFLFQKEEIKHLWEMFHFSKWIRTSAEEISAVGAGFTNDFGRQTQNPGFSQLTGFDPAPRKTHSFQNWWTGASKGIFMDLDSPSLGKTSRGVQCGDSSNCT